MLASRFQTTLHCVTGKGGAFRPGDLAGSRLSRGGSDSPQDVNGCEERMVLEEAVA